jgi:hypothetical protein
MTAKFNADILDRLGEATTDELNAALAAIREDSVAYAGQPASQDTVNAVTELSGAAKAIREELTARQALSEEQAAALADLDALTTTEVPPALDATDGAPADGNQAVPVVPGDGDDGDDNNDEGDGDDADDADDDGDQEGQDTVTASGRRPLGGVTKPPAAPAAPTERVTLRTTASAGLAEFSPGAALTREELATAFSGKARAVAGRNVRGYERYPVATIRSEYPESRHLARGATAFQNMEKVERVVDEAKRLHARENATTPMVSRSFSDTQQSLTAAGLCAPLETLYDIRVIGDTDRPVRDALTRFGADRGGIQYRPALDGVTQTGGIGVWTAEDDADTTEPLPTKTCVEIACPGVLDAEVDAVYQCLTFSNMSTRFDPEFMDSVIRAQAIAHARFSENRLLTQLTTGSKTLYTTQLLGATRDILATLDKVVAYYRNVHRLADETALRWIAPLWAKYLMRADIVRQMVGDGLQALAVTDAMLNQWLAERNINVTWHLDGIDPADIDLDPDVVIPAQFYTLAVANTLVPVFPDVVSTLLFAEGDWLYLDGGTLDLGVVRDSALNERNRFQTFSESFETVAFRGIESLHVAIAADPTGASAATVATTAAID